MNNYNYTQTLKMGDADVRAISDKMKSNPYLKFQVVDHTGEPMFAIISVQVLKIVERVLGRLIGIMHKESPDVVGQESLQQLEQIEAEQTQSLTYTTVHKAASGQA